MHLRHTFFQMVLARYLTFGKQLWKQGGASISSNVLPGAASAVDRHFKTNVLKRWKIVLHLRIVRARHLLPKCYLFVASIFVSKCLCGADSQRDLLFLNVFNILRKKSLMERNLLKRYFSCLTVILFKIFILRGIFPFELDRSFGAFSLYSFHCKLVR